MNHKRRIMVSNVLLFTITSLALFTINISSTSAQTIHWNRWQDNYAVGPALYGYKHTGAGGYTVEWVNWVKDATNGRLLIKRSDPGLLVPPAEALRATGSGVIDGVGQAYGGMWVGTVPEADIEQGLPMAWPDMSDVSYAYYRMGFLEEIRKVYAERNVYVIGPCSMNLLSYNIGTTFPINSPGDLKGKKIRASGIYAEYVRAYGGSPVSIPASDVYMALKLGTIDGAFFGVGALEDFKMKEVFKYFVVSPSLNSITNLFLVNMDAWKKLPQDIQYILNTYSRYPFEAFGNDMRKQEQLILADAVKNYGLKAVTWSEADQAKSRETCVKLWASVAAKSPRCAKLVEMVTAQAKLFGRIK